MLALQSQEKLGASEASATRKCGVCKLVRKKTKKPHNRTTAMLSPVNPATGKRIGNAWNDLYTLHRPKTKTGHGRTTTVGTCSGCNMEDNVDRMGSQPIGLVTTCPWCSGTNPFVPEAHTYT